MTVVKFDVMEIGLIEAIVIFDLYRFIFIEYPKDIYLFFDRFDTIDYSITFICHISDIFIFKIDRFSIFIWK